MNLLNESRLREFATRKGYTVAAANEALGREVRNFSESSPQTYDVFLSHRTGDAQIVVGLKAALEAEGLSVYVYWVDNPSALAQPVTRDTADRLRAQMRACRSLVYADTAAATDSKWMPWELGYLDGLRERVAILPVASGSTQTGQYTGREYLGLYPWIRTSSDGSTLAVVDRDKFIAFLKNWIKKT